MVESSVTISSESADSHHNPERAESPIANPVSSEGYNLIVVVKSLSLNDFREDVQRMLRIVMVLGESEVNIEGTENEINQQRRGNAVRIPCANAEELKQYLTQHNLDVVISHEGMELGRTIVQLAEVNLTAFEPPEFEPTVVSKIFTLQHGTSEVGTIHLILKTDLERSSVELNSSKIENDTVLFIVNDSSKRRSSEHQEETMRQMLTCMKCNALRSPSDISCRYELIDGILANCETPKRDVDLEMIKRKIEQIEREAKLYPAGKQQEPSKDPEGDRYCNTCGGYTVTGVTCNPLLSQLEPVQVYPIGSGKRFEEFTPSKMPIAATHISELDFTGARNNPTGAYNYNFNTIQQQENKMCPTSVGIRHCQRCGLNLDWLPLHAHCPKCGFKCQPERPASPRPKADELTPSVMNSWLGSFEFGEIQRRHSSIVATGRSVSLEEKPCPLCRLRGGRCPDCERRKSMAQQDNIAQNSTNQSSTSDSEILNRKAYDRPKTRQSLRDRFSGMPKKITKSARMADLKKVYGEETSPKQGKSSRRSTRSSLVSLNVEEILKKADTHKRKVVSDGVQSVELRKVGSKSKNSTSDTLDKGCSVISAAQIRKNQRVLLRRIRKQNQGKYSYLYGNRYPGIVVGHRECVHRGNPVPPHMGWQWNVSTPGIGRIRKGWRPGAVRKPIKELMRHFLVSYPLDNIPVSRKGTRKLNVAENDADPAKQEPTLQIEKRNGEYVIVMKPLKDSKTLKSAQDPYLSCPPIRLKLAKDPNVGKLYQLRNALKVKGFTLCGCADLGSCTHRSDKEKKLITQELRRQSKRLGLPRNTEIKEVPVESESDLDLEFTPPSAMLNSGVRKPDVVCTETQYCEADYKVQTPADKLKSKPGRVDPRDMKVARKMGKSVGRVDPRDTKVAGKMSKSVGRVDPRDTKVAGKVSKPVGRADLRDTKAVGNVSTPVGRTDLRDTKAAAGRVNLGRGLDKGDAKGDKKANGGKTPVKGTGGAIGKFAGIPVAAVGATLKQCRPEPICDTSRYCTSTPAPYCCQPMSMGYNCQMTNACYTSSCAPAVCGYNACCAGCM
ncbi:uncharacterized protein LOC131678868 [Topomyia yanbarensis]|uniref:uncharacterized protein LOC131678868 n=1 Tax=Topomyia yanbarensis TaxID=2498891 RepID=UPI00273BC3AE|nr:uncharacterized protein LOC131678868 [Topomyia yanbarensis]